jgi:hypothetical protein
MYLKEIHFPNQSYFNVHYRKKKVRRTTTVLLHFPSLAKAQKLPDRQTPRICRPMFI